MKRDNIYALYHGYKISTYLFDFEIKQTRVQYTTEDWKCYEIACDKSESLSNVNRELTVILGENLKIEDLNPHE